jgi:uncharacterized membrane protein YgcG
MDALEQVTVLMTLMRRLTQVMDHERTILRGMRLDALREAQHEKGLLAEAYEIELRRLRGRPELVQELDPAIRAELFEAMRAFQERLRVNRIALEAAREVVEKVVRTIGDSLREANGVRGYTSGGGGTRGGGAGGGDSSGRGQVVSLALNREV